MSQILGLKISPDKLGIWLPRGDAYWSVQGLIKGYHRYRRYYTAGFIPYQYLLSSSLQCPTTRSSDVGISHHRNEGNTLTSKRHPVVAIYQVCPVIFSNPVLETYCEVTVFYQKVTMSAIILEVYCTCCTVVWIDGTASDSYWITYHTKFQIPVIYCQANERVGTTVIKTVKTFAHRVIIGVSPHRGGTP